MTTNRVGPGFVQPRRQATPVRGDATAQVQTQGVPQHDERVAVQKLQTQVDARDLDVFLKARAGQKQKGLVPSLQRLLAPTGAGGGEIAAEHARVSESLRTAVDTLRGVYADGLVTERELGVLGAAQGRLQAVLGLATPDVLSMLPRDVRARLEANLFEPLGVLAAAAGRRGDRVMHAVAERDEAALRERLADPRPTYRVFNPAAEARAGRPLVTAERFRAGDLVAVPRSDGRSTLGVVVDKDAQGQLRVEMIDEATDRFALKTLSAGQLLAANPIKIGDYLEIDDKQIWVKGVGRDGRLEAYVKQPGKEQITVGGDAFASLVQQAQHQHAYATALERLPGMNVVPEVTQRLARYALDVGPSDKVFGRLSLALHAALERPAALGATPKEQADALTTLLRQDPAHLHAVLPNFRTERAPAHVAHDVASQGPGAHPLMRPMAGTAVPGFRELAVTFFHGVEQHTLRVVEPFPPPPPPAGKRHATMAEVIYNLAKLPYDALKEVKNVVVNPTSSPDDAFWQREFNDPNHAAYMSADKANRTLSLFPARDFSEMELSLAHEVGHFVGHAKLGNPPNTKGNGGDPRWTRWDAAQRTDNISVSRYAKNNLDEDFAETYSLYTMSKGTPAHAKYRGLMPNRFAVLDALTGATAPQQPRTS